MVRIQRRLIGWVEYSADQEGRLQEIEELVRDFRKGAEEQGFLVSLWLDEARIAEGRHSRT